MVVLGVDACRTGWIGILLDRDDPPEARWAKTIGDLAVYAGPVTVMAIDIPIGLSETDTRPCDLEARIAVGARRSSVFLTPIRAAIEAPSYTEANAVSRELGHGGVSRQAYGMQQKILEVDAWWPTAPFEVCEVHPELSFKEMAGEPLDASKHTWSGIRRRHRLLERAGIVLRDLVDPGDQAGDHAAVDDVLDAAAAAWSARRIADGTAFSVPSSPPPDATGRPIAIWA